MPTDEARRGPGDAPQLSAGREEPAASPASCTSAGSSYTSSALWRRRLSSAAHARPVSTARGRPAAETDDPGGGLYERPHGQHRAPRSRPSAAKDGGTQIGDGRTELLEGFLHGGGAARAREEGAHDAAQAGPEVGRVGGHDGNGWVGVRAACL